MVWLVFLGIALSMVAWSRWMQEEVHAIAIQITSLISFIWGYSWAPPSVQLLIASLLGSAVMLDKRGS